MENARKMLSTSILDSYNTFEELYRGFGGESNVLFIENEKDLDAFIHDNLKHTSRQRPLRIFRGQNQAAWICRSLLLRKSRELYSYPADEFKKIIERHNTFWKSLFSSERINEVDWLDSLDKGNDAEKYGDFKEYMRNRIEKATKLWSIQCGVKTENAGMAEVAAYHYGLPTHHIGFTESLLYALFFATQECEKINNVIYGDLQKYISVICYEINQLEDVDIEWMLAASNGNIDFGIRNSSYSEICAWVKNKHDFNLNINSISLLDKSRIAYINRTCGRNISNPRSLAQKSVLISLGAHSNLCLEDVVKLVEGKHKLHCILISRELIPYINELLERKGINEESLGLKIK